MNEVIILTSYINPNPKKSAPFIIEINPIIFINLWISLLKVVYYVDP